MTDEELSTGWSQDASKPPDVVHYGSWSDNMEIYDWEGARKERDEQLERQEKARNDRLEVSKRMEQSWELIRICKSTIKEKGSGWKDSSEARNLQRKLELEKADRLERADAQRNINIRKITEDKILKKNEAPSKHEEG